MSSLMATRGLTPETLEECRERLNGNCYFSSMVLAAYDNILGPSIVKVWSNKVISPESSTRYPIFPEPSMDKLLLISSYAIKDEAGREEKISGIETKFYALQRMDIIACSYIFRAAVKGKKVNLFAFFVTLPYSELNEFMPRFSLCQEKICQLLQKHLIAKMEKGSTKTDEKLSRMSIKEQMADFLPEFSRKLLGLCQMMISVRYASLALQIPIEQTLLGAGLGDPKCRFSHEFIAESIACHLQMGGYSIVFGEDKEDVNKMLNTLGLFLCEKERKMSRTVPVGKGEGKRYIPNLFVQGYLKKDGSLPFSLEMLWKTRFPSTIIDVDEGKVYTLETTVPVYLRRLEEPTDYRRPKKLDDLAEFDRGREGQLVKDFLRQMMMLPATGGVRESLVMQFVKFLKLKAVAVCKYLETDVKDLSHSVDQDAKVNKDNLAKDIAIGDLAYDLYIVLSYAEKMRCGTYRDVLGDPQRDIEHILTDLEFV